MVVFGSGNGCRMRRERLIRPGGLGLDLVGLIRRASVASGTECRMRRERLIRPT
ncbi:ribonucleoside-diphosphate reductase subunit beta, partial [Escherichia coli KTE93]